jgi:hypothetical protein
MIGTVDEAKKPDVKPTADSKLKDKPEIVPQPGVKPQSEIPHAAANTHES